ncbi:hypothetical protein ACROYT_G006776 [Oculina patagonica]
MTMLYFTFYNLLRHWSLLVNFHLSLFTQSEQERTGDVKEGFNIAWSAAGVKIAFFLAKPYAKTTVDKRSETRESQRTAEHRSGEGPNDKTTGTKNRKTTHLKRGDHSRDEQGEAKEEVKGNEGERARRPSE